LIPIVDRMTKVILRLVALDVDPQDVITRDNVSVKVNAVIYFRVIDPVKAIIDVENYGYAVSQLAQTTLRSVCGEAELDELLAQREKINAKLQEILDMTHTAPGHQGHHGLKQIACGNAAGHCAPGGGRTRTPRQGSREASSRRPASWRRSPSSKHPVALQHLL
jgi:hypothetical protein